MGVLDDLSEVDLLLNQLVEETTRLLLQHGPWIQKIFMDVFSDMIFVPRIVAKQMMLAMVLETGRLVFSRVYHYSTGLVVQLVSSRARMLRQLTLDQQSAQTQDEYMMLAEQHDALTQAQTWRMESSSPLYERDRIATTIDHYLHLMRRSEVFDLLFLLRGNLGRNQFGLLHQGLFSHSKAGTKVLVETYHNVVCAALEFVCDAPVDDDTDLNNNNYVPTEAKLAFFNEVRHAYGRSSLLLSGGAALGFYHVGVVKALMENNLMPRVIGGASAGSIVCAMVGTRTDEECIHDLFHLRGTFAPGHSGMIHLEFFRPLLFEESKQQKRNKQQHHKSGELFQVYHNTAGAFHDPKRTWQLYMPVGLRQAASTIYDILTGDRRASDLVMHDTEHFKAVVKANCGNFTFQEAFDRTGRICNIIVSPKNQSDPPRLLNYLTAPHVLIWSAAVASASVPGIFEADCLLVKDPDGTERYESSDMTPNGGRVQFSDGSFEQDLPMQQLSEMFNVNHFIISQVNPQAVLFGSFNHRSYDGWSIKGVIDSLLCFLKGQCRSWLVNLMKFLGSGRFRPLYAQTRGANIATNILTQEYEGRSCDISLIPWLHHRTLRSAFLHMLYNPTRDDFFEWTKAAERETWKFIPRIKCHIAEEIALDQCVQRLRNRLILEARQKRRGSVATNNMIGNGLPSFFVSPSLTNLESRGSTAAATVEQIVAGTAPVVNNTYQVPLKSDSRNNLLLTSDVTDLNSGWAGMGLLGNRSSGSLERQFSHPSGLFIDEEENPQQPPDFAAAATHMTTPSQNEPSGFVVASGKTMSNSSLRSSQRSGSHGDGANGRRGSMAEFYYRRASETNLAHR
ncbi:Patatin-like phospholipase domain-containing protein [Seminavis robusta]|uniref:Patatin-like phospholipase domain-containing protein n=1 Tax=Seminavis robusta TaxID=568900 RepID=A0A9N8HTL3_9STRA|nr:Patatin-like phospholipase domain-containing protein [Seminavis robusta]|eukprot:Sro1288_g259580.1 Patatin-like phospholipase domain-containing protein (848) ;mRNA; f:13175-16101